jgi:hypothetical protein
MSHRSRCADEQARVANPAGEIEEQRAHDPNVSARHKTKHMLKPSITDWLDIRVEKKIVREA